MSWQLLGPQQQQWSSWLPQNLLMQWLNGEFLTNVLTWFFLCLQHPSLTVASRKWGSFIQGGREEGQSDNKVGSGKEVVFLRWENTVWSFIDNTWLSFYHLAKIRKWPYFVHFSPMNICLRMMDCDKGCPSWWHGLLGYQTQLSCWMFCPVWPAALTSEAANFTCVQGWCNIMKTMQKMVTYLDWFKLNCLTNFV